MMVKNITFNPNDPFKTWYIVELEEGNFGQRFETLEEAITNLKALKGICIWCKGRKVYKR